VGQWDAGAVTALHAGVYNADGSVVGVVGERLTEQVLQLAGDGLLDAIAQDVEGAVDLAAQCVAALRERNWLHYSKAIRSAAAVASTYDPVRAGRTAWTMEGMTETRMTRTAGSTWRA